MPEPFSPFSLKSVTLRNRIAMSPMTHSCVAYPKTHGSQIGLL